MGLPGGIPRPGREPGRGSPAKRREETGWDGRVERLLRINSRPDRAHEDRQNVAFDFVPTPIDRIGEPDDESSAVEWFPLDRLPPLDALAFDHGETGQFYIDSRLRPPGAPILDSTASPRFPDAR